jgi:hypothetical protein
VFLGAWIYVNKMGGFTLVASETAPLAGAWPFPVYDVAFCAAVVAFGVAIWALSSPEGRQHLERGAWLLFMILATFQISYWGAYGPLKTPVIGFPWGTLIEVGVGLVAFYWGVLSGFTTSELREIVTAQGQQPDTGSLELLPVSVPPPRPPWQRGHGRPQASG